MGCAQIYIKPPSQFVLAVLVHVSRCIGLGTCSGYSLQFSLSLSDVSMTARNERDGGTERFLLAHYVPASHNEGGT